MAKKKQPHGICIYCGSTGLSKEHLYADWLKNYIPRELSEHKVQVTVAFPHTSQSEITRRTGDPHVRKLRRVCLSCNQGWMSDLQQSAKPHLVPILSGDSTTLNRKGQKIVSAWAAMTAMTAEYLKKEHVAVSQADRDHLRTHGVPPKSWRIWIASISGSGLKHHYWHNAMALTDQKVQGAALHAAHPSNTQTSTIGFGEHLLVYAMSTQVGAANGIIRRWTFPPALRGCLRQI